MLSVALALSVATSSHPLISPLHALRGGDDGTMVVRESSGDDASDQYRGGKSVSSPSTEQAPSTAASALASYVEELGNFMTTFDALVERATSTSKGSLFFGFTASAARVRQRPDRRALRSAHVTIRELYHDAVSHACDERQHLFAATTLRLHMLLSLLLRQAADATAPDSAPCRPPPALISAEEAETLDQMRSECTRKPKGTIAEIVAELRTALEGPAASHMALLYLTLAETPKGVLKPSAHRMLLPPRDATGAADATDATGEGAAGGAWAEGSGDGDAELTTDGLAASGAGGGDGGGGDGGYLGLPDDLEREVVMALEQAEEAQRAHLAQQEVAEKQMAEHAKARADAEAQRAAEAARAEAAEQRGLVEEARAREADLDERLRLASQAAAQAAAAEAAARGHASQMSEQLSAAEARVAELSAAAATHEEGVRRHAELERQVEARIGALAALGRELPDGPAAPAVPLMQHRELQIEIEQLNLRHAQLQQAHAAALQHCERQRAELPARDAYARDLAQRLEAAEAQLAAGRAYQRPAASPAAAAATAQDGSDRASGTAQVPVPVADGESVSATSSLGALGGSLLASFGRSVDKVAAISKNLVGDLAGLQDGASVPDGGAGANAGGRPSAGAPPLQPGGAMPMNGPHGA